MKNTHIIRKFGLLAVAASLLTLNGWAEDEKEETITIDQAPAAVQETIKKQSADGKVEKIERETEDGKVTYEVKISQGDKKHEVEIDEAGKVLEIGKAGSCDAKGAACKDEKAKDGDED